MIHDQIQLAISKVRKQQDKLKDIRKDIKEEEKIDNEQYEQQKAALKDLRKQVKQFEEDYLSDLQSSEHYKKLREMRLEAEEELAEEREKLFTLLEKVPLKPFEINVKEEEGFMKIQALPEMRIYVDGKEVKRSRT